MLINAANIRTLFEGFNVSFNKGFEGAESHYRDVAMIVPSITSGNTYGWLGQFPKLREWVGDRVIRNLAAHSYAIENKDFESTISVHRNKIEDDQYGIFDPLFQEMGRSAAEHPDELVFALLAKGFETKGYDGRFFFDSDHPVKGPDGQAQSVSNVQAGAETPWFLLDGSRAIKPLLFQPRRDYKLARLDREEDENVFMRNEYIYGVAARANAGFGLWQLAFASKAALTADNYEAARQAMMEMTGDEGRPLGIKPNTLVVPPALEGAALRLLNNGTRVETVMVGDPAAPQSVAIQNEWNGTAKPVVSAWLA
ncbi:Mu-like prophage major head subunit gpT [Tistlia consotensis]|uniref:Mu-like prophage major head subunit gpT n=1 Tax=Tistlia consotensis USBA 355 TaxID=560819 RepID=A0A1Y6C8H5_9PROT|nr:Mu-like prophage major head subunit gpT family protein [Tistlia consotensis]SMF42075.1 Mu-like prophage major head subunit gpT [Tistlia consotensis USBA 355]SMF66278.1 Mu-like prophage major head subunit gpT [Tistlia consotensis USBA 355]SNR73116.1 Mu-like prophage major head subunit gpT [Tistlia consotensis]